MNEESRFGKEKMQTIDIEKKRGLLEELNVPPKVIKFIHENARNLQLAAVAIVVVILGWSAFDYYHESRRESSSAALYEAMQEADLSKRQELLQNVMNQYSGTDAAVWSRLELAHMAFDAENLEDAAGQYEKVRASLSSSDPLLPLVLFSLAQTYEAAGKVDKALESYALLQNYPGFAAQGFMGAGRMLEDKGDVSAAREAYAKIKELTDVSEPVQDWVADKLARLGAVSGDSQ